MRKSKKATKNILRDYILKWRKITNDDHLLLRKEIQKLE